MQERSSFVHLKYLSPPQRFILASEADLTRHCRTSDGWAAGWRGFLVRSALSVSISGKEEGRKRDFLSPLSHPTIPPSIHASILPSICHSYGVHSQHEVASNINIRIFCILVVLMLQTAMDRCNLPFFILFWDPSPPAPDTDVINWSPQIMTDVWLKLFW